MTIRESLKKEIDTLPDEVISIVRDFVLFQKYRSIFEMDDTAYLSAIPGMMASIQEGGEASLSECVPISEVWPDV